MAGRKETECRRAEFLAEAEDILNAISRDILRFSKAFRAGIIDPGILNRIFRSAHSLKGISSIFDCRDVTELSHALEDKLDLLRHGRVNLSADLVDAIMCASTLLSRIIQSDEKKDFSYEVKEMKAVLDRVFVAEDAAEVCLDPSLRASLTGYECHRLSENLKNGRHIWRVRISVPVKNFDSSYRRIIETLKDEAEVIASLPSKAACSEDMGFEILVGTEKRRRRIEELLSGFGHVEINPFSSVEKPAEQTPVISKRPLRTPAVTHIESMKRASSTVRVDIGKLERIMTIVSELGILRSRLVHLSEGLKRKGDDALREELSMMERDLDARFAELKNSVIDLRMVPIGRLFGRFETFIHRLSRECGKEIRLVTHGDETELDKLIIEELADPLMHTIRNSIDHGIETPDERKAAGKPPEGTLTLSACQRGRHVVVEVKDDGAGIDEELVCRKALEKGLIDPARAGEMTREEKLDLVFLPGLTTTDVVSITSGRGVGLDVVRENITRQHGIIEIETVKGRGTRFIFTIPVTQAIMQSLVVEDGGEFYALPTNSIFEIVALKSDRAWRNGYITVNRRKLPAVRLANFFRSPRSPDGGPAYGIIAGLASHRLCLVVERLHDELDIVVKPIPVALRPRGISGAADTGEKGTILVLDVPGILEKLSPDRPGPALSERIV